LPGGDGKAIPSAASRQHGRQPCRETTAKQYHLPLRSNMVAKLIANYPKHLASILKLYKTELYKMHEVLSFFTRSPSPDRVKEI
jgi:hypothetical protein